MNYFQLQEEVFNYLWSKHQKDNSFTFSVRQAATKGGEKNHFIGKEKSNYFAFTCWDIYVSYPGSSGDLISFIFKLKGDAYNVKFEFGVAKDVKGEQNLGDLAFGYELLKQMQTAGIDVVRNPESNKTLYLQVPTNSETFNDFGGLIDEWERIYGLISPVIDTAIESTKLQHPAWQAGRYTKQRFDTLINKMHKRIQHYSSASKQEIDSLPEENDAPTEKTALLNTFPLSLNTILYGPPGTGKTYKLQTLINDLKLEQPAVSSSTLEYSGFAAGYKWWQLMAMVLLEVKKASVPDMLKHPLLVAKFGLSNIQHPPQRLWSTLQHHTVESCPYVKGQNRFGELIFYKEADSTWRLNSEAEFKQEYPFLVTAWEDFKKGATPQKAQRHFTFITCHQSLTYEDFIEGIKPSLVEKDETVEDEKHSIEYEIRKGLFYDACNKAAQRAGFSSLIEALQASKDERKEAFQKAKKEGRIHVLFLDEINRCNVSAVFGELITLIEEDKRMGAGNEIAYIELPYSQDTFGVPANLYVIGTMNTADRSVEALDTALRRRFAFEAMEPDYTKVEATTDGIDMAMLLQKMNQRIAVLLTKDHAIGHAWLMGVNDLQGLQSAFRDKIIPLLQEYFYNNYAKIGLVLGDSFFNKSMKVDKNIFAAFSSGAELIDDYSEKMLFSLKDIDELTIDDFKSIYEPKKML